ncbi:CPBP family intramembrane glutamic endopeptidase [cf. Phormidesmis sp. LEGE 11477]|uniref:CPBP family intramembrane glutamic endopeptidase n=1 Tax=cf. Phormidesmis sp. LEGE 11477 TaxID=1828680 RepID=UPI00187ECD18|nr:type II CAAX endopeptidase family protein [cf. Phormidesmis sp. LEGE 11477]MBE9063324.1 CPBP family intramembrane metalloprotease [cf. Phormidesmis sp. LEGE 11477]
MTLKRIVLSVLTLLVAWVMGNSLISSLGEPQVGNQLQLYQTDLLVQASEWNGSGLPEAEVQQFRQAVFGEDALESATEQYKEVRKDAVTSLARLQQQLQSSPEPDIERAQKLMTTARSQQDLIDQIDLRLGMIEAKTGNAAEATDTWQQLAQKESKSSTNKVLTAPALTAATLADLWQDPPVIRSEAPDVIAANLRGWYRESALTRLYRLEERDELLAQVETTQTQTAESTLIRLSLIGLLPSLGGLLGAGLLIALIGQRLLRGKASILAIAQTPWEVPWDWEVVWLVIVGGFLFIGQLALPLVLQIGLLLSQGGGLQTASLPHLPHSGLAAAITVLGLTSRGKALYSLVFYLLMAASTLGVLYWAIKQYLPLSKEWFRFDLASRWPLWGGGGYLVALPLMLAVSTLNQQIWQGQGGNNPILQLVLEERDPIALGMFLFTAAIAAPVFEEILFRGFLLPSLTRYMSTWAAIGLSSLIFATAHLSFSEVLPLTVLGAILGFVYARSRNLMSSILLHSTWNSITMIGLFLLGSGS